MWIKAQNEAGMPLLYQLAAGDSVCLLPAADDEQVCLVVRPLLGSEGEVLTLSRPLPEQQALEALEVLWHALEKEDPFSVCDLTRVLGDLS